MCVCVELFVALLQNTRDPQDTHDILMRKGTVGHRRLYPLMGVRAMVVLPAVGGGCQAVEATNSTEVFDQGSPHKCCRRGRRAPQPRSSSDRLRTPTCRGSPRRGRTRFRAPAQSRTFRGWPDAPGISRHSWCLKPQIGHSIGLQAPISTR